MVNTEVTKMKPGMLGTQSNKNLTLNYAVTSLRKFLFIVIQQSIFFLRKENGFKEILKLFQHLDIQTAVFVFTPNPRLEKITFSRAITPI